MNSCSSTPIDPIDFDYPIEDATIRGISSVFSNTNIPLGVENPAEWCIHHASDQAVTLLAHSSCYACCRLEFICFTLDHLLYRGMETKEKSYFTGSEVAFQDLLQALNKKIRHRDLHFSDFEVGEVIHDLEAEKVILLVWNL
jgi:hypothetical protein